MCLYVYTYAYVHACVRTCVYVCVCVCVLYININKLPQILISQSMNFATALQTDKADVRMYVCMYV